MLVIQFRIGHFSIVSTLTLNLLHNLLLVFLLSLGGGGGDGAEADDGGG